MDPEKQRKIAAMGGKAAHAKGVAHQFNTEEAQAAGVLGGLAHSAEHMSRIGKLGGAASAKKRWKKKDELQE